MAKGIKPFDVSPDLLEHPLPVSHMVEFIYLFTTFSFSCAFYSTQSEISDFFEGSSL
jgi:hypothetical protein